MALPWRAPRRAGLLWARSRQAWRWWPAGAAPPPAAPCPLRGLLLPGRWWPAGAAPPASTASHFQPDLQQRQVHRPLREPRAPPPRPRQPDLPQRPAHRPARELPALLPDPPRQPDLPQRPASCPARASRARLPRQPDLLQQPLRLPAREVRAPPGLPPPDPRKPSRTPAAAATQHQTIWEFLQISDLVKRRLPARAPAPPPALLSICDVPVQPDDDDDDMVNGLSGTGWHALQLKQKVIDGWAVLCEDRFICLDAHVARGVRVPWQ